MFSREFTLWHTPTVASVFPLIKLPFLHFLPLFKSFLHFFHGHFVPDLSFWRLTLFCHKQEFFLIFMQIFLLRNIVLGVFSKQKSFLIFSFQIFFIITLHVGGFTEETCPPSLKILCLHLGHFMPTPASPPPRPNFLTADVFYF